MSTVPIPDWNAAGVLPPVDPTAATSVNRSPYEVNLTDLVLRFNSSPERQAILHGFLRFRTSLHEVGLTQGFQWIDGSFLENVEKHDGRAPLDIDVVTFYHLPPGRTQRDLLASRPTLFAPENTKPNYRVDAYFVQLDADSPERLMKRGTYWYSMWSHRRDERWKGFLQVDLGSEDDGAARANLAAGPAVGELP